MDIRKRGNIIACERAGQTPNIETLSQDAIESLRRDLEKLKDDLSTVYMTAQPMHNDVYHLHYKLEAAEKLTEVVHDKNTSCLKDISIEKEFQKPSSSPIPKPRNGNKQC